jgi:NADPH:quinone reductase-like Zn-dependent oxidoreductase
VGSKVTRFRKGDNVVTLFNQGHLSGSLNKKTILTGLGGTLDGTLRQYGVFSEEGLVEMPPSLSWLEASTLSCAALTSWNALYGLKPLVPGQVVLTQGTGGVSLFGVQFAKAAGATVIATTSSARKCKILKNLGADYIINYKEVVDWGKEAKDLTPDGAGVDQVIEVGGSGTMAQSLEAVKIDGVISIIGFLTESDKKQPSFLEALSRVIIVRGALVGNRMQFEEMASVSLRKLTAYHLHNIEPSYRGQ